MELSSFLRNTRMDEEKNSYPKLLQARQMFDVLDHCDKIVPEV